MTLGLKITVQSIVERTTVPFENVFKTDNSKVLMKKCCIVFCTLQHLKNVTRLAKNKIVSKVVFLI